MQQNYPFSFFHLGYKILSMYFIDSHAHLTDPLLYPEVATLLQSARNRGIDRIVNICTDTEALRKGIALQKQYPFIRNCGATHPHDVESNGEIEFKAFRQAALDGQLVGIGETGLDYFYLRSPKDIQKAFLRKYLLLARECSLPVIIHCREAFEDFFPIIDDCYPVTEKNRGLLHCFTGTLSEARELLARGWFLSFSGIVTFKKSEDLRRIVKEIPIDRILIETDSPYLAPQKHRGKTNRPEFLPEVAETIAAVKEMPLEEAVGRITGNTERFFLFKNEK